MNPEEILREAIALRKCVRSKYNGDQVTLAPHALYTHFDQNFLYAVTIDRNGNSPKQTKLGVFKLAGLKSIALDERAFLPMRKFDSKDSKLKGTVIATV